jgi:MFS family permease
MPNDVSERSAGYRPASIESRASWVAAGITLAILSLVYGSTLVIVVGLRAMEADLGVPRSVLAVAGAFTWVGTGAGGIAMGWLADRIGIRNSVLIGTVMVAAGLTLCATGRSGRCTSVRGC